MGADADATIVYGLPFEGEGFDCRPCGDLVQKCRWERSSELYDVDPEKWLAEFQGLIEPTRYGREANESAWEKYREAQKVLPIIIECEGDIMSGIIANHLCIREASLNGDWGRKTKIPVGHIKPPPVEWDALLKAFCERAGVPFEQPDWYLLVCYG